MTTTATTLNESYTDVEDITREIRALRCRFPRPIKNAVGVVVAKLPCRSNYIFTCPSCALRQRADRYTLALDGIEGHDPQRFCLLTLTPPSEASESGDTIREWNALVIVLLTNLLANIRRIIGNCGYIRAVEFQCVGDRAGLAHIHILLRFKRTVTPGMRESIWDLATRTTTRGASRRWTFGAGPEKPFSHEMFVAASVQAFDTTEQVKAALGYTLKNGVYRAADQMGWGRFSELAVPEERTRNNNSGGAGFRGRLISWSAEWSTVTLKAIRNERRLALNLPSFGEVADLSAGSVREAFGWAEVFAIAEKYAHVLLVHIRNRRASAALE